MVMNKTDEVKQLISRDEKMNQANRQLIRWIRTVEHAPQAYMKIYMN